MQIRSASCCVVAVFSLAVPLTVVAMDVRSDGSDGSLTPTVEAPGDEGEEVLVVDLSTAITGAWNRPITSQERADGSATYGRGVYDPQNWAIVFKYDSVHIPKGLRVTFKNHPSRAPVVWLVSGDVTIEGTVDLGGQDGVEAPKTAEPGPGGFRGGIGAYSSFGPSSGYGLGGGEALAGGSYATKGGGESGRTYGSPSLVQLLGGSGGGGTIETNRGGGAGGGALLIACGGTLRIDGSLVANGGAGISDGGFGYPDSGCGAGGGIRLVATNLTGQGRIEAIGGAVDAAQPGGHGRIRLEVIDRDLEAPLEIVPTPSVAAGQARPKLWSTGDQGEFDAPSVRVVSIGGFEVPQDPRASFGANGADLELPETNETEVIIEATQVEPDSKILVRIAPRTGGSSWVEAIPDDSYATPAKRFRATVPVAAGFSTIQVLVRRP